jgi:hypothetical protein
MVGESTVIQGYGTKITVCDKLYIHNMIKTSRKMVFVMTNGLVCQKQELYGEMKVYIKSPEFTETDDEIEEVRNILRNALQEQIEKGIYGCSEK